MPPLAPHPILLVLSARHAGLPGVPVSTLIHPVPSLLALRHRILIRNLQSSIAILPHPSFSTPPVLDLALLPASSHLLLQTDATQPLAPIPPSTPPPGQLLPWPFPNNLHSPPAFILPPDLPPPLALFRLFPNSAPTPFPPHLHLDLQPSRAFWRYILLGIPTDLHASLQIQTLPLARSLAPVAQGFQFLPETPLPDLPPDALVLRSTTPLPFHASPPFRLLLHLPDSHLDQQQLPFPNPAHRALPQPHLPFPTLESRLQF